MSHAHSISTRRRFGMSRVCRIWGAPRLKRGAVENLFDRGVAQAARIEEAGRKRHRALRADGVRQKDRVRNLTVAHPGRKIERPAMSLTDHKMKAKIVFN